MTDKKEVVKKSVKKGDVVLSCTKIIEVKDAKNRPIKKKVSFDVTAAAFSACDFYGVAIVKGVDYYVKKAKELGAE